MSKKLSGATKRKIRKKTGKFTEDRTSIYKIRSKARELHHQISKIHVKQQTGGDEKVKKDDKKNKLQKLSELFKHVLAAQKIRKGINLKSVVCVIHQQQGQSRGKSYLKHVA